MVFLISNVTGGVFVIKLKFPIFNFSLVIHSPFLHIFLKFKYFMQIVLLSFLKTRFCTRFYLKMINQPNLRQQKLFSGPFDQRQNDHLLLNDHGFPMYSDSSSHPQNMKIMVELKFPFMMENTRDTYNKGNETSLKHKNVQTIRACREMNERIKWN